MVGFLGRKYRPPHPTDPEKQPQIITDSWCLIVVTVNLLIKRLEPMGLLTLDLVALMQQNIDSSEYMTVDKSASAQSLVLLQNAILLFFIFSVKRGFRAATLPGVLRCSSSAGWIVKSGRWVSSSSDWFLHTQAYLLSNF